MLVGVVPVFGTVSIVVQLVVGSLLVCSVGVGCAPLVARPSLLGSSPGQAHVARLSFSFVEVFVLTTAVLALT